jgi:hypothetical protein
VPDGPRRDREAGAELGSQEDRFGHTKRRVGAARWVDEARSRNRHRAPDHRAARVEQFDDRALYRNTCRLSAQLRAVAARDQLVTYQEVRLVLGAKCNVQRAAEKKRT